MKTVEQVAEEMFDVAALAQSKRMYPNKQTHSPRDVACLWEDLFDEPQDYYRALAQYHLSQLESHDSITRQTPSTS